MDIGFTGTQKGMTTAQAEVVWQKLMTYQDALVTTHSGDCVGADDQFLTMCIGMRFFNVGHPPINDSKRAFGYFNYEWDPEEYLVRNHIIVDCSDLLIATPGEMTEQLRSGTWATIRYARKKFKKIYIVFPDGSVKEESHVLEPPSF